MKTVNRVRQNGATPKAAKQAGLTKRALIFRKTISDLDEAELYDVASELEDHSVRLRREDCGDSDQDFNNCAADRLDHTAALLRRVARVLHGTTINN